MESAAHVDFEQDALNECRCRRGVTPVVRMPARIGLSQGLLRLPASDTAIANSAETGSGAKRRRRPNAGDALMPEDRNQTEAAAGENAETLTISSEKVCFIIVKAREFDAKDAVTEPDPASNPTDDKETAVLEDHEDDPVLEELTSLINSLSEDEQIDLVALAWLGRDDYSANDWSTVREEAARAHNENTASYLLGTPLVGDLLEEGFSMLAIPARNSEGAVLRPSVLSPWIRRLFPEIELALEMQTKIENSSSELLAPNHSFQVTPAAIRGMVAA
ncbi:MAG: DUF3775 domain-containing protein [Methyloceanibacter sp.]